MEDGFSSEKLFSQGYSYTYDDVIFLPHYIDFPTDAVALSTKLSRNIPLSIPCVSSPMDTVTESHMAAAMAALGGIGIVHSNSSPSVQASFISSAKSRRVPILSNPVCVSPENHIESEQDFNSSPYILVTESGTPQSKLLGYISKADWVRLDDKEVKIYDHMSKTVDAVPWNYDLTQLDAYLEKINLIVCH